MNVLEILSQLHVCQLILENGTIYKDIFEIENCIQQDMARLTCTNKMFCKARQSLFCNDFILKVKNAKDYNAVLEIGARRVHLVTNAIWIHCLVFDFNVREKNLIYFRCDVFNRKIESFGSLQVFFCYKFNQPVRSFGSLKEFRCFAFNQPIKSFDALESFDCWHFNQRIDSFGNLKSFRCSHFNYPVKSFEALKTFDCDHFNQPLPHSGFGVLKKFKSYHFNQPIDSFGALLVQNQKIDSFNSLRFFESVEFNQPVLSFGMLKKFTCDSYNHDRPENKKSIFYTYGFKKKAARGLK
jgi:hypothetical protein